jgi:hypothetical protein
MPLLTLDHRPSAPRRLTHARHVEKNTRLAPEPPTVAGPLSPGLPLYGNRVGPVPAHDRDHTTGAAELAHLVSRLTVLARRWLPPSTPDPMRHLFELVAHTWRLGRPPRRPDGTLSIHRAEFGRPIAWPHDLPASHLDLVLNHQGGHHQLVDLYPVLYPIGAGPSGQAPEGRHR